MKSPTVERIEYGLYLGASAFVRLTPRPLLLRIGRFLGRLYFRLDRRHRELAQRNLRECGLPETAAARAFENFGAMALDSIKLWSRSREWLNALVDVEGAEHFESALRSGGVVLFTAHYGNWEMGALYTGMKYGSMLVIARALDNRLLERRLQARRQQYGNQIVDKRDSARPAIRILRSGGTLGILIDQRVHPSEGILSRFLGRPAYSTPAAARLALQTRASLVPGICEIDPDTGRYRAIYRPAIPLQKDGADRPIEDIVQDCNDAISAEIRRQPENWLWMHDRWKLD